MLQQLVVTIKSTQEQFLEDVTVGMESDYQPGEKLKPKQFKMIKTQSMP
jgi:hypothetical protein